MGVGGAYGSRQPTLEKNPLTQQKVMAGEAVMGSVVLHENGMGDGMAEKKEEKMTVSVVDASVQAKTQTNETESMTWDKSIDQREKVVMKETLAPDSGVKNRPFGLWAWRPNQAHWPWFMIKQRGGLRKKWA